MKRVLIFFVFTLLFQISQVHADAAVAAIRKVAIQIGDPTAQFLLGYMYDKGQDVREDKAEAAKWYRLAAQKNHADAQYHLALLFLSGKGVTKQPQKALELLKKASAENDNALFELGNMHYHGTAVKKDYQLAMSYYNKAAKRRHDGARMMMAEMYRHGHGVKRDVSKWFAWMKRAAEARDRQAQYKVGWACERGFGTRRNLSAALKWYKLSAEQNYAKAYYALGLMYSNRKITPDFSSAMYYLKQAKQHGIPEAQKQIDQINQLVKSGKIQLTMP